MPEIPDLEAIRAFFNARLPGQRIEGVTRRIPVIFRTPDPYFTDNLIDAEFGPTTRRGKFLLFSLHNEHLLVVNAMLTGRFQYLPPEARLAAKTCLVLDLSSGRQLRYADDRVMGKIYLVRAEALYTLPQFAEMGPDALDVSLDEFRERIRKFTGQIKSVLVNHKFIAGIGNAYADEILWAARINPYRKRTTLSPEDIGRLYQSIRDVIEWAIPLVAEKMRDDLDYEERRDFLRVHRRGGQPCPNCGHPISEITAGNRITSFCRHCQPD